MNHDERNAISLSGLPEPIYPSEPMSATAIPAALIPPLEAMTDRALADPDVQSEIANFERQLMERSEPDR